MLERVWRKGSLLPLLVGRYIDAAAAEDSLEIPKETRNKTTIGPSNPTPRHMP